MLRYRGSSRSVVRCLCGALNDGARIRCFRCGATIVVVGSGTETTKRLPNVPSARTAPALEPERRAPARPPAPPADADEDEDGGGQGHISLRARVEPPSAFLHAAILEKPYPIRRESTITIGRFPQNTLVLPVSLVSRQHAVIAWDGRGFTLTDVGSTNGTFVNGVQLDRPYSLGHGDRIGIGPFELIYVKDLASETVHADFGEQTGVFTSPTSSGCFSGALGYVSMPEICQMIDLNQKSGVLTFQQGELRGAVFFLKGRAIHAELGDLKGDGAALALLSFGGGTFSFSQTERFSVAMTIKRSTASLLMEAMRCADEASQDPGPETHSDLASEVASED